MAVIVLVGVVAALIATAAVVIAKRLEMEKVTRQQAEAAVVVGSTPEAGTDIVGEDDILETADEQPAQAPEIVEDTMEDERRLTSAVETALDDLEGLMMPEGLPEGISRQDIENAMKDHFRAKGIQGVASSMVSSPNRIWLSGIEEGEPDVIIWSYKITSKGGGEYMVDLVVNSEGYVSAYEPATMPGTGQEITASR